MTKCRRIKGLHDIITISRKPAAKIELEAGELSGIRTADGFKRKDSVACPRTWVFATRPRFIRHLKPIEKSLLVEKVEEPVVSVFEEAEEVVVLAEMPGAEKESIRCKIKDDILFVSAEAKDTWGTKRYEKEILLPFVACPSSLKTSYENQILEIKLARSPKGPNWDLVEKSKKKKSPNSLSSG